MAPGGSIGVLCSVALLKRFQLRAVRMETPHRRRPWKTPSPGPRWEAEEVDRLASAVSAQAMEDKAWMVLRGGSNSSGIKGRTLGMAAALPPSCSTDVWLCTCFGASSYLDGPQHPEGGPNCGPARQRCSVSMGAQPGSRSTSRVHIFWRHAADTRHARRQDRRMQSCQRRGD